MNERTPNPGGQHPEEYRGDLNPNAGAGQNNAAATSEVSAADRTAFDDKELHGRLPGLTNDELKQIVLVPAGDRLEQGATYFDIAQPARGVFTATGAMLAEEYQRLVPKAAVDYVLWNRLTGVTNPDRLDEARS